MFKGNTLMTIEYIVPSYFNRHFEQKNLNIENYYYYYIDLL